MPHGPGAHALLGRPHTAVRGGGPRQPRSPHSLGAGSLRPGGHGARVREVGHEMRNFARVETVVDRALAMAQAEPPGPVYLTLPREVLAERHETFEYAEPSRLQKTACSAPRRPTSTTPRRCWRARATRSSSPRRRDAMTLAVPALVALAETLGAPVFQDPGHNYMNFPGGPPAARRLRCRPPTSRRPTSSSSSRRAPWYPRIRNPRPERA